MRGTDRANGLPRVPSTIRDTNRFTLYSVKGGVGRTTTAAVLAWQLAHNGQRVLVVDLDLESPGLSSAMLSHISSTSRYQPYSFA